MTAKQMTAKRADDVFTPYKVRNLTVQEVIAATEFSIPVSGPRGDISRLCHLLTTNEELSLDECIEIGNHFNIPDVWDAIIMSAFYPFKKKRCNLAECDIELKPELSVEHLRKMLEGAKNKDPVIEAVTDRLNVMNRLYSDLSARTSSARGPLGWPSC